MTLLQEYYRPDSVNEALELLAQGKDRLVPLAGGTLLVGQLETRARTDVDGVVDLQDAGLGTIREADGVLYIGAMCTLSSVTEYPMLHSMADGLLERAARGEGPQNLRNAATVGGVIACAEYDSEFYAALLALDAAVTVRKLDGAEQTLPLDDYHASDDLITEIRIPVRKLRGGAARIARTPSDRPIVAAVAVRNPASQNGSGDRIALCGVASRPVLQGAALDPPNDFKGSATYRLAMADIVAQRAVAEIARTELEEATKYAA